MTRKPTVMTGALRAKAGVLRASASEPVASARIAPLVRTLKRREVAAQASDFSAVFRLSPVERIRIFKQGISSRKVDALAARMKINKNSLIDMLRLSRGTLLSQDESERLLGLESIIGRVQVMAEESGDRTPFDAAAWLGSWLQCEVPALGGKPAALLDSVEGQKLIGETLAMSQSGTALAVTSAGDCALTAARAPARHY